MCLDVCLLGDSKSSPIVSEECPEEEASYLQGKWEPNVGMDSQGYGVSEVELPLRRQENPVRECLVGTVTPKDQHL